MTWSRPPDNLDLQPGQVDVWRIALDLAPATVKNLESALSADESQRAARFHFPADRKRYILAHGCLRAILARYLNCEPAQLCFSTNDYGKPALEGHDLEFNLSHSGNFALIAIARGHKVGVDVEHIRANLDLELLAERFFSPGEAAELAGLPPEQKVAGFFNGWSRKEAYIKAHGLGLSMPLDSFDVSLAPFEPVVLRATRPDENEAARWTLSSLHVDPEHAGAVAAAGKNLVLRLWDWNT